MRSLQAAETNPEHAGPLLHPLGRYSFSAEILLLAMQQARARDWLGENTIRATSAAQ